MTEGYTEDSSSSHSRTESRKMIRRRQRRKNLAYYAWVILHFSVFNNWVEHRRQNDNAAVTQYETCQFHLHHLPEPFLQKVFQKTNEILMLISTMWLYWLDARAGVTEHPE